METRQEQVVETIRSWITHGTLSAGQKLTESGLAEALGVSRTPVRHALTLLVEEGLLTRMGPRGYTVRTYRVHDVLEAIELRALIEGYAARTIAIAGPSPTLVNELNACLTEGDSIFSKGHFIESDENLYASMNLKFHRLIIEAAGGTLLKQIEALIGRVPFAAPDTIAFEGMTPEQKFSNMEFAHRHHHAIFEAICQRDGARAEALFREHATPVKQSLGINQTAYFADSKRTLPLVDPETPISHVYNGKIPEAGKRRPKKLSS